MELPSHEVCEELFDEFKVPSNIKNHCKKVNQVAVFLANKLKSKNIEINVEIVDRVSLLHDLMKPFQIPFNPDPKFKFDPTDNEITFWKDMKEKYKEQLSQGLHESELFSFILGDRFPDLTKVILKEGKMGTEIDKLSYPIEFQIIHYADWRIFLDNIVPFEERIDDLFERYKHKRAVYTEDFWKKFKENEFKLEQNLFQHLDFSPEKLNKKVNEVK